MAFSARTGTTTWANNEFIVGIVRYTSTAVADSPAFCSCSNAKALLLDGVARLDNAERAVPAADRYSAPCRTYRVAAAAAAAAAWFEKSASLCQDDENAEHWRMRP